MTALTTTAPAAPWTEEQLDAAWEGVRRELDRKRREEQAARIADVKVSEAYVERMVELRIGELQRETPDILTWSNETGVGYQATVKEALCEALAPFGPYAVKAALGAISRHRMTFGQPGSPDRWVVAGGRAAGMEIKRPRGGVVSEVQERWHAAARRRSCFVTVITDAAQVGPALERCRRGEVQ